MTDKTPAASACPDCRALIPATMEDRTAHRTWHADLTAKHRGVQKRIAELAEVATRAADQAATATRDVRGIEIPEPVEPMRIEDWPEDELDDPRSTYLDDDEDEPVTAPVASLYTPRTTTPDDDYDPPRTA